MPLSLTLTWEGLNKEQSCDIPYSILANTFLLVAFDVVELYCAERIIQLPWRLLARAYQIGRHPSIVSHSMTLNHKQGPSV